jgi:hypothetical protein
MGENYIPFTNLPGKRKVCCKLSAELDRLHSTRHALRWQPYGCGSVFGDA